MIQTVKQYLSKIGSKGGKASAKKLTKEQLVARAKKAVQAREAKRGAEKGFMLFIVIGLIGLSLCLLEWELGH